MLMLQASTTVVGLDDVLSVCFLLLKEYRYYGGP